MHIVDELFEDLWQSAIGRSFVCNFLDGIKWKNIEKTDGKLFVINWLNELGLGFSNALKIVDYVASTSNVTMKSGISPATLPDYIATSFSCRYLPVALRNSPTAGLTRIADLVEQYGHARTNSERFAVQSDLFIEMEARSGGEKNGLIEFSLTSNIAGPRPFAWFTSYDDGDIEDACWTERSNWSTRPDLTRDNLGLIHRGSTPAHPYVRNPELMGTYVVGRSAIPPGIDFCRPSCLDAGSHSRFRFAFGNLARKPEEWGRALHLERLIGNRPHRGGRELVVENFVPNATIKFTILGEVLVPRSDFIGVNDDKYEVAVRRNRDENAMRKRFFEVSV